MSRGENMRGNQRNLWENSFKLIFEFSEEEKKEKDFWLKVWCVKRPSFLQVILHEMMNNANGNESLIIRFSSDKIPRIEKELIPFVENMHLWDEEQLLRKLDQTEEVQ